MRQAIIGVLIAVFGTISALVLERGVSGAPGWAWRLAAIVTITVGAVIVVLSEPAYSRLVNYRHFPFSSTLIVSCVSAVLLGAAWLFLIAGWWPESSEPSIRSKYSSQQIVEISSAPGNYNETLNLDNVATMIHVDEASRDVIAMLLLKEPPVTIEKPRREEKYKTSDGLTVQFPSAGESWIEVGPATLIGPGQKYVFDRFSSSAHVVEVRTRRFRVTLQSITDKSSKKQMLISYTFGISEI